MSQRPGQELHRSYAFALVTGLAAAASVAMLWAIAALHGSWMVLTMPFVSALTVNFALGLHGLRGRRVDAVLAASFTLLASAFAAALTVGVRMAIQLRLDLHHALHAMGPEMTWSLWRAQQTWDGDLTILLGIALAVALALRAPRTG